MPFYTFDQNNSGGFFTDPAISLIVEADNADEANDIAEEHGVYFDDDYDIDCDCCGTRWYRVSEHNATEQPEVYGQPAEEYDSPYAEYDHVRSVKVVRK